MRVFVLSALAAVLGCSPSPPSPESSPPSPGSSPPSPESSPPSRQSSPEPKAEMAPVRSATPSDAGAAAAGDPLLVDVMKLVPDAVLDVRYATRDNFTKVVLYSEARCLLRPKVAKKLVVAAELLRARGYRLRLWDCYRPFSVQEKLFEIVSDPRYVGRPKRNADGKPVLGSRHNRAAAIDLSLVSKDGADVSMPTGYDDFTAAAHRSNLSRSGQRFANARLLEKAMVAAGFVGLPTEWWHFDAAGWKAYPLLDLPFESLR